MELGHALKHPSDNLFPRDNPTLPKSCNYLCPPVIKIYPVIELGMAEILHKCWVLWHLFYNTPLKGRCSEPLQQHSVPNERQILRGSINLIMQLTAVIMRKTKPQKEKVILAAGPCFPILSYPHKNDILFPLSASWFSAKMLKFTNKWIFALSRDIQLFIHTPKVSQDLFGFNYFFPQTWKFTLKRDFECGKGGSLFIFFFLVNHNFQQAEREKKIKEQKQSWRKQMLLMKHWSGQSPHLPGK